MPYVTTPVESRFWPHVDQSGGPNACWPWMGSRSHAGHGRIDTGPHSTTNSATHRVAWELTNGPIPEGLFVLHICDYAPCCNPRHLYLGTPKDNARDAAVRGRLPQVRLTVEIVREARDRARRGDSVRLMAAEYGVSQTCLGHAVRGVSWAHVPDPVPVSPRRASNRIYHRKAA